MAQLHIIGLNPTTGKLENLGGSNDSGGLVVQPSGASSPALEIQNNGSSYALKIDNNAASSALLIDHSGTEAALKAYASNAVAGAFESAGGSHTLNVEQSNTDSDYAPSAINISIGSGFWAHGISVSHDGSSTRDAFRCIRSGTPTYRLAPTGDI